MWLLCVILGGIATITCAIFTVFSEPKSGSSVACGLMSVVWAIFTLSACVYGIAINDANKYGYQESPRRARSHRSNSDDSGPNMYYDPIEGEFGIDNGLDPTPKPFRVDF